MDKRSFFPKRLVYLFSFDIDLRRGRRGAALERGEQTPGGVITSQAHDFSVAPFERRPAVYNVLNESRVLNEEALEGRVDFAQDTIHYVPRNDFAEISGRLVIRTKDEHVISGEYAGVARAGRSWLAVRSRYGDHAALDRGANVVDAKAHVRGRFETGSTKYQWLVKYQCLGYGKLSLCHGEPTKGTFDIYAVT